MSENTDITSLNGKKLVAQMRTDNLFDGDGNHFDISALGAGL